MERRRFLGWAAAGAVASGVGIAALRASSYAVPAEVAEQLVVLRPWQYVVIRAIGERVLAPETADVGLFADHYFEGLPEADRSDLTSLIAYVEHVAPLTHGFAHRFSSLDPTRQDRVLAALEEHPVGLLRGGFQALKAIALMTLYRRDSSWGPLGYGGPAVRWSPG